MHFFQTHKMHRPRGFTLIELLVSVALFSIVMMISVGTLLTLVDANRKAQNLRNVTDNLSFALDSMTRNIRTGHHYYCGGVDGSLSGVSPVDVNNCNGPSRLVITDDQGVRTAYELHSDGVLYRIIAGTAQALTSPDVNISALRFYVSGAQDNDALQPTVTMALRGTASTKANTKSSFTIQTTATQRLLDLDY